MHLRKLTLGAKGPKLTRFEVQVTSLKLKRRAFTSLRLKLQIERFYAHSLSEAYPTTPEAF
jgi:hypothetical protein